MKLNDKELARLIELVNAADDARQDYDDSMRSADELGEPKADKLSDSTYELCHYLKTLSLHI